MRVSDDVAAAHHTQAVSIAWAAAHVPRASDRAAKASEIYDAWLGKERLLHLSETLDLLETTALKVKADVLIEMVAKQEGSVRSTHFGLEVTKPDGTRYAWRHKRPTDFTGSDFATAPNLRCAALRAIAVLTMKHPEVFA